MEGKLNLQRTKRASSTSEMGRVMSNAQAALAEAIETFGRIDILLCNTSEGASVQNHSSL